MGPSVRIRFPPARSHMQTGVFQNCGGVSRHAGPDCCSSIPAGLLFRPTTTARRPTGHGPPRPRRCRPKYYNGTDNCAQYGVICPDDGAVITLNPQSEHYAGYYTGWFGYGWNGYGFNVSLAPGLLLRSPPRPGTGDGSPQCWRADASWGGRVMRSPAWRCGRRGRVPRWRTRG